jgi:Coenzyme PQQ synthesis protein D (PqqD)
MASSASRIAVPGTVFFREVAGEAVLLDTAGGGYFGLDEVGTRMWTLLARHGRVEPVVRELLAEFDVDEARLRADATAFVDTLASHGLVEVVDDE